MGAELRRLRKRAGRTGVAVARGLRVSYRTYCRWESGRTVPDAGNLIRLSEYWDMSPKALMSGAHAPRRIRRRGRPATEPVPDPRPWPPECDHAIAPAAKVEG